MRQRLDRPRPALALRNYAAAALLNLALVSTILVPPDRAPSAQTRVITNARRRDAELVALGAGETGVISVPYEGGAGRSVIGAN